MIRQKTPRDLPSLASVIGACAFLAATLGVSAEASAGGITDPSGQFSVGIGVNGELYDYSSGIGFQRLSDGYDPLAPGIPRDSWGVEVVGVGSAYADQSYDGAYGINSTTQSIGASSATSTSVTNLGLTLSQAYSFVAPNVMQIAETVTNTSSSAESVVFQRDIDWDVSPTEFDENTFGPTGASSQVIDSSYYGFENPDPSVAYDDSCAAGCNVTGDLGGGIKINVGTLAAGASDTFDYFYGISQIGQSVDGLISEAQGLGAGYIIATQSSENGAYPALGANSAFIGFGVSSAPEPSTWLLMMAGVGFAGAGLRRRAKLAPGLAAAGI